MFLLVIGDPMVRKIFDNPLRIIGRTIIYNYLFPVGVGLRQDTFYTLPDVFLMVISWSYNTHQF